MSDILSQIYGAVLPPLLAGIAVILGTLLRRLSDAAGQRWGIEIEARHRDALHSALMTGITAALSRGVGKEEAVSAAIRYTVAQGAPDAVEHFGLRVDDLKALAESKLTDALARVGGALR